jgi:tRNA threonylcarbamoyladenosine biosynthesis protein TsaE
MPVHSVPDEKAMISLGIAVADSLLPGTVVFVEGELGAGKTTLVRGILRGLGHEGIVVSPTYTLVEPYQCGEIPVYHFDLYRLNTPDELETIGVRDMIHSKSICLVEWPDRGAGVLPAADMQIRISYDGAGRKVAVMVDV